jgi:hypothetical protein
MVNHGPSVCVHRRLNMYTYTYTNSHACIWNTKNQKTGLEFWIFLQLAQKSWTRGKIGPYFPNRSEQSLDHMSSHPPLPVLKSHVTYTFVFINMDICTRSSRGNLLYSYLSIYPFAFNCHAIKMIHSLTSKLSSQC